MLLWTPLTRAMREPSVPLRFGRYEVLFRIAAGGMAEVYAARMLGEGGFEKPVALKRMLPTLAEDDRFVQMFLDEGRLAAHISSPHVVQTLDLGRAEDDSLYLVMELVVGVSLSALIRAVLKKRAPFPVPVAVDVLAQAAMGLHDAHEARTMYGQPLEIVHRDVSPQNILVDVSGRVRITDFGVARALERATHTQSGEVKGKIAYFAPEQVRGKAIDRRTDVYALGIVAWETLAGRRLFSGENPAQTLDMVMSMPVPRLDTLRSDVPAALADAVAHALERDVAHRTASAGDFAEALRHALRPAGSAAVGTLVREHGGESLMKLEEGLRAQSPSALSRVRRASNEAVSSREIPLDLAPLELAPSPAALTQAALTQAALTPAALNQAVHEVPAHTRVGPMHLASNDEAQTASGAAAAGSRPGGGDARPRLRYLVLAIVAIGLLGAVGVGIGIGLAGRSTEPQSVALPLPPEPHAATGVQAETAPEARAPEPMPAPVLPAEEGPSEASPSELRPRPRPQAHVAPRPRPSAEPAGEGSGSHVTPEPQGGMAGGMAPSAEPPAMAPGMSTGLVGVGQFEEELGF